MRSTQLIGHTKKGDELLDSILSRNPLIEEIEIVTGMFNEEVYVLKRYEESDGTVWEEYVQAEIWSAGPMIYLGLKNNKGEKFEWTLTEELHPTDEYNYKEGIVYGVNVNNSAF